MTGFINMALVSDVSKMSPLSGVIMERDPVSEISNANPTLTRLII